MNCPETSPSLLQVTAGIEPSSAGGRKLVRPISAALAILTTGTLSIAVASGVGAVDDEGAADGYSSPDLGVIWDYRPDDLPELIDASSSVVLGTVTEVEAGPPLTAPAADDETARPFSAPTQLVSVRVDRVVEGSVPSNIELFKLGSDDSTPAGDPTYTVGEKYLLFVRPQGGSAGTYIATAPDGRFERSAAGELEASINGPIARDLEGLAPSDAVDEIEAAARE